MALDFDADLENPDVGARRIVGFTSAFLLFVAVSLVALQVYYAHARIGASPRAPRAFPAPGLETRNGQNLSALLEQQRVRSQAYAWVERARGRVRIPVSKAMAIVASRGAKAYDPLEPSAGPGGATP
jgi:hypothetical protein